MNLLTMNNVSKAYGIKVLLSDISFGIDEGEKIGLLGVNGSGKSTFLKLVAGQDEPDKGSIVMTRNLRIQYLPQNAPFEPERTVMETVLSGDSPAMQAWRRYQAVARDLDVAPSDILQEELAIASHEMEDLEAWNLDSEAKGILTRLGIDQFDVPMGQLSGGQRKRVALAAALLDPADLLILDEPTNHLDNQAIDWLEKRLQRFSGALLMVTHDRYFLERIANRIIEVEQGNLYSYPGNYAVYIERKLDREENDAAMARKRESLLRKELAWIQKGARARTTKQKARIERFEKLQADEPRLAAGSLQISSAASRLGKKTIVLDNISHGYAGERLIANFSCILARDERLGIVGPNGIGKSTLLRIMSGEIIPDLGTVETGSTVKIGYFPQESSDLPEDMRVIEYIREAGEYLQAGKKLLSAAQMLETFLFTPASQWTTIQKLSGGERRRLHLLRILMTAPNVLLLDEPGNDLDIETLTILEDYLDDFKGAVVAVSHDRYFLDRMTDSILAFEGQERLAEYPGNYSDYLVYTSAKPENKPDRGQEPALAPKANREAEKPKSIKFTFKEQREFDEIDHQVALAEDKIKDLNRQIDKAASDYLLLEKLLADRREAEKCLDEVLERWTYLQELAEEIERQKINK
ncbi:MAG: ABC-F family ATP-binding cassette domain-containing protein [Ignavibacteriales bacterium]